MFRSVVSRIFEWDSCRVNTPELIQAIESREYVRKGNLLENFNNDAAGTVNDNNDFYLFKYLLHTC